MKAVRYQQYGDSDVLAYVDTPRPVPGPGQVLVQVAGTSFNPVDATIRSGVLEQVFPVTLPHVPGVDVAGTVAELGDGVEGWQAGDEVVAFLPMTADGAAAEYVVAPAGVLAAAPSTVDLVDAAALPAVALTAWQALHTNAQLKSGQTVLVNGAGGAVGGYAVQFAKEAGATVTATASDRSAERVRGYGADRIVDYRTAPVTEIGEQFDVVLNLVPTDPETTAALVQLVADGGVFVSTTTPGPENPGRGVRTSSVFVQSDATQLADLVARLDAGKLQLNVAGRRRLADLPLVHAEADGGHLAGKTVLHP
ncbi:NADP-dependent oxidoreductase [Amycolatopsis jejuensis]|uniref:NADP-dependent oxidoreductase n=1 Tax=Amycolatopsis jejuensis TaxID=330084 RepID=UPI000524645B|nr:NADP-dependent oxidoreductase [Amycolatopsis jejuensis]